ncbi:MAG: pilus assembly protein [Planctomycetota bacterium]|nr:pilus assembly protein [Planctomycetota bacterium]MDA1137916.1 pilus assembly protein [Planctomycetota bacterium]
MIRKLLQNPACLREERGQVIVEFALIFPIQLFMTLAMLQLSHMYMTKLTVNHAAFVAARAAVVVPESNNWISDAQQEAMAAATMIIAPLAGTRETTTTDTVDIPGWNSRSGNRLERHGAAEDKTRVTIARTPNQNSGPDIVATVEYDFELIFLPDKTIMGAWSNLPGQTFQFNSNYNVSHLTLTESCTLPRNWDIGAPSNQ